MNIETILKAQTILNNQDVPMNCGRMAVFIDEDYVVRIFNEDGEDITGYEEEGANE